MGLSFVAGIIKPFIDRGDVLNKEDANDILTTGIYNMRASGGLHTGIMLVFRYENTCVQIQVGTSFANVGSPVKRFRYMPAWTNSFTDWFDL